MSDAGHEGLWHKHCESRPPNYSRSPPLMEKRFLPVAEAAQYLGFNPSVVRRMICRGELPVVRFPGRGQGRVVRIDLKELNLLIEKFRDPQQPERRP